MDKVSFSGSKISLISRFEGIISARAGCCKRKLLPLLSKKTLRSGIELISEFPKERMSACTGRLYSIRQELNCRSKNVIYLGTCKACKVQYVGSTSNELKVRFRNHKLAMLTNKATCELAVHFNKKEHHMSDFEFIVIEKLVNDTTDNLDKVLLTREAFWCSPLCTLQPYGLSKRSEFNSKNRIRFN